MIIDTTQILADVVHAGAVALVIVLAIAGINIAVTLVKRLITIDGVSKVDTSLSLASNGYTPDNNFDYTMSSSSEAATVFDDNNYEYTDADFDAQWEELQQDKADREAMEIDMYINRDKSRD